MKPTHRLEDMTTNETSLVDRAANLRTFLVVKAKGGAPSAEMVAEVLAAAGSRLMQSLKTALAAGTEAERLNLITEAVVDSLEVQTGVLQALRSTGDTMAKRTHLLTETEDVSETVTSKGPHHEQRLDPLAAFLDEHKISHREVRSHLLYLRNSDLGAAIKFEETAKRLGVLK